MNSSVLKIESNRHLSLFQNVKHVHVLESKFITAEIRAKIISDECERMLYLLNIFTLIISPCRILECGDDLEVAELHQHT